MLNDIVAYLGFFLLGLLPVVGIILMAARRRDHGRAAIIGIMGCVALIVGVVFNAARRPVIQLLGDLFGLELAILVSTVISLIFSMVGTGLLIWAVVARRPQQQPAPSPGPGGRPQQQPAWGQPPQPPFQQQAPGWQHPQRPPFSDGS
ncbi:hypothetical protein EDD27_6225 [Nonomuraea polychroma]|uniref:Uncharacterized protein n=1 Tax=Nonomuraea polychroma TaxID=46176 RepID=A0A438MCN6_9ACTN|nr:hypothetical protein [Nonomuraea polychroma]RVX43540.1 hypothetical protein EDD27_6225 [Nonomuraea polychroma]